MNGTLQFRIGDRTNSKVLALEFNDVFVDAIPGGLALRRQAGGIAVLWDEEITEVVRHGGGPTPLSALLVYHLVQQKFLPEN